MRVRGLKYQLENGRFNKQDVAPRAGAWIEIDWRKEAREDYAVAPRAGAWIEIDVAAAVTEAFNGRTPCGCVD